MTPVLDALALSAGAAAAVNPCGVGLLPTYLAFLLGRPAPEAWPLAAGEGLVAGLAMTVGLLVPFALLAATFGAVAGWLGPRLPALGAGLGVAVALWGVALLVAPEAAQVRLAVPVLRTGGRGVLGVVAYGAVFGLASLGCTFPVFLSLLLQSGAAGGALAGAGVVLVYALGMGLVVTALAVLARTAATTARRLTARAASLSPRLVGLVVLASGAFVVLYWTTGLVAS